jgi:hypothetical protein
MRILRWIAFLPAAAIVGLMAGKLGEILRVLIFHGETWSSYLFSGLLITGCFILVGLKVAPLRNSLVKWVLIAPCLAFGITSTIGSLLSDKPVSAFAGLGIILASLMAFGLRPEKVDRLNKVVGPFKFKKKQQRQPFESFAMDLSMANPSISIEEVLEQYIKKYNLAVPHHPDEPTKATMARTKLQILEESSFSGPRECPDPTFQNYLFGLRALVHAYNTMSPEARKLMKQKEETGEQQHQPDAD